MPICNIAGTASLPCLPVSSKPYHYRSTVNKRKKMIMKPENITKQQSLWLILGTFPWTYLADTHYLIVVRYLKAQLIFFSPNRVYVFLKYTEIQHHFSFCVHFIRFSPVSHLLNTFCAKFELKIDFSLKSHIAVLSIYLLLTCCGKRPSVLQKSCRMFRLFFKFCESLLRR